MVMNVGFLSRSPWLPLVLLWLAYALLGWYLSAHHIVWLLGAFVAVLSLAVAWKSSPLLERFVRFGFQGWFAVLTISLILSISVALAVTWSIFLPLIVIPLVTTILAEVEMRFVGLSRLNTFLFLTVMAGVGLGLGELIDIVLLPSMRY